MPGPSQPSWSDSPMRTASDDEDDRSDTLSFASTSEPFAGETTILGFADGWMKKAEDCDDWRTSRVGGLPAFPALPRAPQSSAALCGSCQQPMPLLTQIYCPLPDSNNERALYVFGCPSPACRRKEGTVRAWRVNTPWIEEEEEPIEEEPVKVDKIEPAKAGLMLGSSIFGGPSIAPPPGANPFNPFAPPPAAAATNALAQVAKAAPSNPFAPPPAPVNPLAAVPAPAPVPAAAEAPPGVSSAAFEKALAMLSLDAPADATPSTSQATTWPATHPCYPPQYLTTAYEPPAASSSSARAAARAMERMEASLDAEAAADGTHREGKGAGGRTKKGAQSASGKEKPSAGGDGWGQEGYEVQRVKGVDEVFLRFQERVAREPSQLVRYDPTSLPLPFSASSAPSRSLFPTPPGADPSSGPFAYAPGAVTPCKYCEAPRRFELQLMPHLVGTLNRAGEKKAAVGVRSGELDFAGVWVFTCEEECGMDYGMQRGEGVWREEEVEVEWED